MFKLLKELAKAPEPLLPPSHSHSHSQGHSRNGSAGGSGHGSGGEDSHGGASAPGPAFLPYAPRSRSRAGTGTESVGMGMGMGGRSGSAGPSRAGSRRPSVDKADPPRMEQETDPDAVRVVLLLRALKGQEGGDDDEEGERKVGDAMRHVEIFSQLLSVPGSAAARRAFRRYGGFDTLREAFSGALAWSRKKDEESDEEDQVRQVQRMEGVRLAFEVLAWAQGDRDSVSYFERHGGYPSLLPILYKLSPHSPSDTCISVISPVESPLGGPAADRSVERQPDPQVLAQLSAHILSNDYTCLSIFSSTSEPQTAIEKLSRPTIRWASGLPTLFAYALGASVVPQPAASFKGKEKQQAAAARMERFFTMGRFDNKTADGDITRPLDLTLRLLIACAEASTSNLFAIQNQLPNLAEWLITRIYGPAPIREFAITFPARPDWAPPGPDEDEHEEIEWQPPPVHLRPVYLALLRKLLEAGASRTVAWRLFALVRKEDNHRSRHSPSPARSPSPSPSPAGSPAPLHGALVGSPSAGAENGHSGGKKKRAPGLLKLHIPTEDMQSMERLDPEVLDLLRHGMKARWPSVFVFDGGLGDTQGGLEMRDLSRSWPKGEKGFTFSTWLYITRLNHPITLIHCSQSTSKHPFLHVKVLENSQISIATTQHTSSTEAKEIAAPDDIICPAPDALIPHGQWVHFGLSMRHPKGVEIGEARIYVNGNRVGAMRVAYPVPTPPALAAVAPQLGVKPGIAKEAIRVAVAREWDGGDVKSSSGAGGRAEENEWMLGRMLLVEEAMPEDILLLMHHLGPRYSGNLQEPLGKFLTYEGATSINVYLHALARDAKDKRIFSQPATAVLARAIRSGPAITEENILLSLCAKDIISESADTSDTPQHCINGGVPHPSRARQVRNGVARLVGRVDSFSSIMLDQTVNVVGGGAVVLKIIEMSGTPEELGAALCMLRDLIKDDWAASEEMERIHGFDLLAAILRPKMPQLMDVTCAKIVLSILGINTDKPLSATVHNSVAYRALGLDFELWSSAPIGVISVYLQHFATLLTGSKHTRYNVLRTFQKSAMVKRLLYALRSGFYDPSANQMLVDTLTIALTARWSSEDAIKPTFSYLVSSLCQNNAAFGVVSMTDPAPSQMAASLILASLAELLKDEKRLIKLNRTLALHRLLVIFISSNSAYYVVMPCLEILKLCVQTSGLESFARSFEGEGGFALLGRTLGPIWRQDIQDLVWDIMVDQQSDKSALQCVPLVASVTSAIESLLLAATETDDVRPTHGRRRSGTATSIRSISMATVSGFSTSFEADDTRLEDLLRQVTLLYRESSAFRRNISTKRVESMLPYLADFAAVSATSGKAGMREKRAAASELISAIVEKSKSRLPVAVLDQMKLVKEQLAIAVVSPSGAATPTASGPVTPISPPRTSNSASYFGSSLSSRLASSPSTFNAPAPFEPLKRRPSTDAGLARVRSGRERRIPLQRTLTGESILEGGKDKNAAWKLIIMQTDLQSHSKMTLERKEHWQKLCQNDWPRVVAQLRGEMGIWPLEGQPVVWRLDGSEGPLRMRNRLERVNPLPEIKLARGGSKLRDAIPSADELSSAVSRMNVAPWEDPFSLALGEASIAEEEPAPTLAPESETVTPPSQEQYDDDSFVEIEENKDDKMRRIAKTLQAGDVVEQAHNIVRIVGVDACPGLLILGRKNLYLIDGLVQTPEGEVIDAKDAPRDALSIPSGTLVELDAIDQQNARWSYQEVVESNKRAFLFRDVALELYFSDKRNFLIVFRDQRQRQAVVQKLASKDEQKDAISRSVIGNFVLDQVARATDRSEQQLQTMTRKWQSREISNFAYLQLLNQHANRTPNDVTQYPVFPWVLSDYTSPVLQLDKESSFRNLDLPMGALTPARQEAAAERYSATEGVGEKPFHYGTHYSSSMIVCGFMIRMSPFTEIFLALQGGNFDLADRLFSSLPRAWDSASSENRGDVRELVPEFFYSAGFLKNVNHHDFGVTQGSNEQVDDVTLPAWALNDPLLFIHRHREALESEYVSKHLPNWIDLVFGYKQRDAASFNCYHPLSYRGAVDLDRMQDEGEKASSTAIIHNFGQTPVQIFRSAHPFRFLSRNSELPMSVKFGVAEQWQLLMRSILPVTESVLPIDDICPGSTEDARPLMYQKFRMAVPGHMALSIQYGFTDDSVRVYYQEALTRLVLVIEGIPTQFALFAHPTLLIMVSPLSIVTAWRLTVKNVGSRRGDVSLTREATLRGHMGKITCVANSKAWSFVVTGCDDGTATVWDTNRLRYVRTIKLPRRDPIKLCAVHECDGTIALASAHYIYLYSLNGYAIASTHVEQDAFLPRFSFGLLAEPAPMPEFTGGITFLNREFLRFGALFVVGIDNELALFRCVPGSKLYEDETEVKPWALVEQGRLSRSDDHAGGDCTAVRFIGETLYAAFKPVEEKQKHMVYQWSLPEGNARHVLDAVAHTCMAERCGKHFGLLEPRRFCGGCGGAFCGSHAVHVEMMEKRYCEPCRSQLGRGSAMGILGARRDSASSRRNSLVAGGGQGNRSRRPSLLPVAGSGPNSRPGSRRPSVSNGTSGRGAPTLLGMGI